VQRFTPLLADAPGSLGTHQVSVGSSRTARRGATPPATDDHG
jgi:hypothetical protein